MFARRLTPTRGRIRGSASSIATTNGHISANTNSALAFATGEYVALLDADDELTGHALFWVANEIAGHPDADLIYSDEDKIDVEGRRFDAYFKPDWNPALILSQNFFCHLGVYRRSLVETGRRFPHRLRGEPGPRSRAALRGADFAASGSGIFPAFSTTGARSPVRRLPPRRSTPSPMRGARARPRSRSICGAAASMERSSKRFACYYQIDYPLPAALPKVSIIVPSTCKLELLKPFTKSLFSRTALFRTSSFCWSSARSEFEDRGRPPILNR